MENKHVNVTTRGFGLLFRFIPGQSRFGPGGNLCREYHVSHWCLGLKEKWRTIRRTIENGLFFFRSLILIREPLKYFIRVLILQILKFLGCLSVCNVDSKLSRLQMFQPPRKLTSPTEHASWNLRCLFFQEVLHESQLANHIRVDSSYPCAEQWLPTHGHFQCISVLFFIPSRNSCSSSSVFRMPHEAWDLTPIHPFKSIGWLDTGQQKTSHRFWMFLYFRPGVLVKMAGFMLLAAPWTAALTVSMSKDGHQSTSDKRGWEL